MGSKDRRSQVSHAGLVKLLAGVGAIITLIMAIVNFISLNLMSIVGGLILLVLGLIVLISCFGSYKYEIPFHAVLILVMGIIILACGFWFGGLFVIIAGIFIIVAGIIGLL